MIRRATRSASDARTAAPPRFRCRRDTGCLLRNGIVSSGRTNKVDIIGMPILAVSPLRGRAMIPRPRWNPLTWIGTTLLTLLLGHHPAWAQFGDSLPGAGPINRSMGGAAVAAPIDPAGALYWNPATIGGLN